MVVDGFPLETHGLEEFLGVLEFYLLSPGNNENKTEQGIVKIVDFEGLNDKISFKIFTVDYAVNETEDDCLVKLDHSREKEKSSCGDDCGKLQHDISQ